MRQFLCTEEIATSSGARNVVSLARRAWSQKAEVNDEGWPKDGQAPVRAENARSLPAIDKQVWRRPCCHGEANESGRDKQPAYPCKPERGPAESQRHQQHCACAEGINRTEPLMASIVLGNANDWCCPVPISHQTGPSSPNGHSTAVQGDGMTISDTNGSASVADQSKWIEPLKVKRRQKVLLPSVASSVVAMVPTIAIQMWRVKRLNQSLGLSRQAASGGAYTTLIPQCKRQPLQNEETRTYHCFRFAQKHHDGRNGEVAH